MRIRDAVAVVTGASSGIGRAISLALAREGATVFVAARRLDRLKALAREIERFGGAATPIRCDVSQAESLEALAAEVEKAHGRCDVLVNNAGVPGGGSFESLSRENIEKVARVNLLSVFEGTRVFLPMMLRQGRGHIVNIASLAGRHHVPGAALYAATKHGVVGFSESLYYELAPKGVLVTSVNPALVKTEGFPQEGLPPRLVMRPERVARAVVHVVRRGIAPQVSVPRWAGVLEVFRTITPGPYRRVQRAIMGSRHGPTSIAG